MYVIKFPTLSITKSFYKNTLYCAIHIDECTYHINNKINKQKMLYLLFMYFLTVRYKFLLC